MVSKVNYHLLWPYFRLIYPEPWYFSMGTTQHLTSSEVGKARVGRVGAGFQVTLGCPLWLEMGVSIVMGYSWMISFMENPISGWELGVPLWLRKPPEIVSLLFLAHHDFTCLGDRPRKVGKVCQSCLNTGVLRFNMHSQEMGWVLKPEGSIL